MADTKPEVPFSAPHTRDTCKSASQAASFVTVSGSRSASAASRRERRYNASASSSPRSRNPSAVASNGVASPAAAYAAAARIRSPARSASSARRRCDAPSDTSPSIAPPRLIRTPTKLEFSRFLKRRFQFAPQLEGLPAIASCATGFVSRARRC